jgi:hypothetical protein
MNIKALRSTTRQNQVFGYQSCLIMFRSLLTVIAIPTLVSKDLVLAGGAAKRFYIIKAQ